MFVLCASVAFAQLPKTLAPAPDAPKPAETATTPATTPAPVASTATSGTSTVEVKAFQTWTDTNLDITANDSLHITAEGSLQYAGTGATPKGQGRSFRDLIKTYPVNAAGRGALIARIGDSRPFLIGADWQGKAAVSGRLWLGVNQGGGETGEGSFAVKVERTV